MKYDDLYCKLFLDSDLKMDKINEIISRFSNGEIIDFDIISKWGEITINKNEDFDISKRQEWPDGFLYYRYYMDIDPNKSCKQADYINNISMLLTSIWKNGFKAVAACDFEDELPRKGGYKYRM